MNAKPGWQGEAGQGSSFLATIKDLFARHSKPLCQEAR